MKPTEGWENNFRKLKKNWDSYDGDPISEEAIRSAAMLLKNLDQVEIGPTADGGISIEWYIPHLVEGSRDTRDFIIMIGPNGEQDDA